MKKIAVIIMGGIWSISFAQSSYSLEQFSPKISIQDGANCYAFASVYVALSTQRSYLNSVTPDSSTSYSFGFVDGIIKYYGIKNIRRRAQELYGGNLYDYGNLDYALFVLATYGTVYFNKFPYTSAKMIKRHFKPFLLTEPVDCKISRPKELITPADYGMDLQNFQRVKEAIISGKPVICAIRQTANKGFCTENFTELFTTDYPPKSNHIVTILGYDETAKTFVVKNNYEKGCTFSIDSHKFLQALSWAYVLNLN